MVNTNPALEEAWNDFKGSDKNSNVIEARNVLDVVSTARTTSWAGVDAVSVYLKRDCSVNEAVENVVERHNLIQIGQKEQGGSKTLYFTTKELADTNDVSTSEDFVMETS